MIGRTIEGPPEDAGRRLAARKGAASDAYSPETLRAWSGDSRRFAEWCVSQRLLPFPASPATVERFVEYLSSRCKPSTVRRHVASIARLHSVGGVVDPTKAEEVKLAVRAMLRRRGVSQKQARPITAVEERLMVDAAPHNLRGLRDVALLLVGRDLLARRAELVSICVEDIDADSGGTGAVCIGQSKTDQEGAGSWHFVSRRSMLAVEKWLAAAKIVEGPVFRKIDRWGRVSTSRGDVNARAGARKKGLNPGEVTVILRRLATAAGLDAAGISGHSMRVGMAQDLAASQVELPALMQAGRWKTPAMPARYVERLDVKRSAVAAYRAQQADRDG